MIKIINTFTKNSEIHTGTLTKAIARMCNNFLIVVLLMPLA